MKWTGAAEYILLFGGVIVIAIAALIYTKYMEGTLAIISPSTARTSAKTG